LNRLSNVLYVIIYVLYIIVSDNTVIYTTITTE